MFVRTVSGSIVLTELKCYLREDDVRLYWALAFRLYHGAAGKHFSML